MPTNIIIKDKSNITKESVVFNRTFSTEEKNIENKNTPEEEAAVKADKNK